MEKSRSLARGIPPCKLSWYGSFWDGKAVFVWSVWALSLFIALVFVAKHASAVPYGDDWAIVPYVTGTLPVSPGYLWEQHNEHRIPLPKLVLLAVYGLGSGDFRAGAYVNVLLLGALAFALIRATRALQDGLTYQDAFVPLLLLNLGHSRNLLCGWQLQFVLAAVLIGAAFLFLVRKGTQLTLRSALWLSGCLSLLSLCGAQGLPYVVLLGGWLGYIGLRRWRSAESAGKHEGLAIAVAAAVPLLLVGAYFVGYHNNPVRADAGAKPSRKAFVRTTLEIMTTSFGPGITVEPLGYSYWPFLCLLAIGLAVASGCFLLVIWRRHPAEHLRVLGLLLFPAAVVGLAIVMGRARAGAYDEVRVGVESRYAILMAPLLYWVYFVWLLYGPTAVGRLVRVILFTAVCFLSLANATDAAGFTESFDKQNTSFLEDLKAGEPTYVLARRYVRPLTYEMDQEEFADSLRMLHAAGMGPLKQLHDNPLFQEIAFPIKPLACEGIVWGRGCGQVVSSNAHLDFTLPRPRQICGIRMKVQYVHRTIPAGTETARRALLSSSQSIWTKKDLMAAKILPHLQVWWKTPQQRNFVEVSWFDYLSPRWSEGRYLAAGEDSQTVTIWVGDTIDRFRIYPDKSVDPSYGEPADSPAIPPFTFLISEIVLLVP